MQNRLPPHEIMQIFHICEKLAHDVVYNAKNPSKLDLPSNLNMHIPHSTIEGLEYYIFEPIKQDEREIKIVFRGTKDLGSMIRDMEPGSAGVQSFEASLDHILEALHLVMDGLFLVNEQPISILVAGHSLGAVDAQNCFAALLNKFNNWHEEDSLEEHNIYYKKINKLRLAAFNSPGTTQIIADEAALNAKTIRERNLQLSLECFWLVAKDDCIQDTGEKNILADQAPDIVTNHLIYITHGNPNKALLDPHCTKYFIKAKNNTESYTHNYEYYSNHNDQEVITRYLNTKNYLYQNTFVSYLKFLFLTPSLQLFYLFKNWQFHGYETTKEIRLTNRFHDAPWQLVASNTPKDFIPAISPLNVLTNTSMIGSSLTPFMALAAYVKLKLNNNSVPFQILTPPPLLLTSPTPSNVLQVTETSTMVLSNATATLAAMATVDSPSSTLCPAVEIYSNQQHLLELKDAPVPMVDPSIISVIEPDNGLALTPSLKSKLLKLINDYIYSRCEAKQESNFGSASFCNNLTSKSNLKFFTRVFGNNDLTQDKIKLALSLKTAISHANAASLLDILTAYKNKNEKIEKYHHKKYFVTSSKLGSCIEQIRSLLEDERLAQKSFLRA